ncbi:tyrosine-type recombinase/integrase [Maribacter sp. ANRC-HE7]|uniref:Tyrosine-type recombinase/integrase n=1 Tax=Maribacter aquimaris TaxID=2737171 RepID=A0ABR7V0C9_9FLAO|nr:site-specific integrase [Maribacter aquimaris]MBD0778253.1 tyrosine-type recombinase/integrase [Maribacter aquimaris]
MASVNFLYRSTKREAFLNVRLLYRVVSQDYEKGYKDFVLGAKTKLKVSKYYWDETHKKNLRDIKDVDQRNLYTETNQELMRIEDHILSAFDKVDSKEVIDKKWLNTILEKYYNPTSNDGPKIPTDLIGYFDHYIEYRRNELDEKGIRRIKVTKNKMVRLQEYLGSIILIKDINEDFKIKYQDYCNNEKYSQNTQQRELSLIKTVCNHARYSGLETHVQLDSLKIAKEPVNHIFLNFGEIEKIKNLKLDTGYLDNARDWLLISCYTGQRVSDFMRFTKENIRIEKGKYFLEFTQQKTKKRMVIPLSKEAREVLKKRGGEFPRPISDQKYNDYIKVVCQKAGLNELVKGKKRTKVKDKTYRDVSDTFEKWELVSSHIGRRSFASNYYGKVPTTFLINITGHSSEKMFLNYIKKSNLDLAVESYKYFD